MFRQNRLLAFFVLILGILMSSILITAQDVGVDDEGNPNDPTVNDRANACYTDERLLGQCDTDFEWVCGYALIRYDYGLVGDGDMNLLGCGAYLPPETIAVDEPEEDDNFLFPTTGCFVWDMSGGLWASFDGDNAITNLPLFREDTCITQIGSVAGRLVYAPEGQEAAELLCTLNFSTDIVVSQGNDVFLCLV